ncbi:uncharacterized protein LOC133316274 [Gastrolobium bilobum]|uniref:uncharacterized protein LOC133316274 n=1 Tax=Gastrolobium bilobum TaxID=150636 RepID=UPI002AB142F8|nr:uncharacterized protein LOC133316274 [Gastrolobium bilobum]
MSNLNAKFERLHLSKVQASAVGVECEFCHENHDTNACPTLMSSDSSQQLQVNGVWYDQRPNQQNVQRNQSYSAGGNNYQRRNYQGTGLDMKSDNYLKPPPLPQKEPSDLERLVGSLAQNTNAFMEESRANQRTTNAFIEESRADARNTKASIKNLENQIGQLAQQLSDRAPGTFPGNTFTNPKEGCMAITTRSGKVLSPPEKPIVEVVAEEKNEEVDNSEKDTDNSPEVVKPLDEAGKEKEQPVMVEKKKFELSPEYLEKMGPYPGRFKPELKKKHYDRFLDIFKKLHINILFAEALADMPNYAKFMKDLLSKKHKLQECQTVALTEECSAIITRKFPPKLGDPGSFNIPIEIGDTRIGNALCDLGASINLMPLSVCKSLGITELKPTMVTLQLADRSLRKPSGIIEDVLVKVDKFIFLADFVVLDMEAGHETPLLLGRPFLATARAMIDVEHGKLVLRMNEDTITVNVFDCMKRPYEGGDCFRVDVLEEAICEEKTPMQKLEEDLKDRDHVYFADEVGGAFEVLEHKESDKDTAVPKVVLKELPETLKYMFLGDDQIHVLLQCLGLFGEISGEKVSEQKTTVFFSKNTPNDIANKIIDISGFKRVTNVGRYLGAMIQQGRVTKNLFSGIIDRVKERLSA